MADTTRPSSTAPTLLLYRPSMKSAKMTLSISGARRLAASHVDLGVHLVCHLPVSCVCSTVGGSIGSVMTVGHPLCHRRESNGTHLRYQSARECQVIGTEDGLCSMHTMFAWLTLSHRVCIVDLWRYLLSTSALVPQSRLSAGLWGSRNSSWPINSGPPVRHSQMWRPGVSECLCTNSMSSHRSSTLVSTNCFPSPLRQMRSKRWMIFSSRKTSRWLNGSKSPLF